MTQIAFITVTASELCPHNAGASFETFNWSFKEKIGAFEGNAEFHLNI